MQALAAIKLAERIGKTLLFHINAGRTETKGEPVLNNLRGLFHQLYDRGHKLIEHEWTEREEFIQLCAKMDIGMQVSFSETFNIVGADIISQGVPLVGSAEIPVCERLHQSFLRFALCQDIERYRRQSLHRYRFSARSDLDGSEGL